MAPEAEFIPRGFRRGLGPDAGIFASEGLGESHEYLGFALERAVGWSLGICLRE